MIFLSFVETFIGVLLNSCEICSSLFLLNKFCVIAKVRSWIAVINLISLICGLFSPHLPPGHAPGRTVKAYAAHLSESWQSCSRPPENSVLLVIHFPSLEIQSFMLPKLNDHSDWNSLLQSFVQKNMLSLFSASVFLWTNCKLPK